MRKNGEKSKRQEWALDEIHNKGRDDLATAAEKARKPIYETRRTETKDRNQEQKKNRNEGKEQEV